MRYLETKKARIEMIPMIDIMLFLLVFFAMLTLRMIPASGHLTKLPTSPTAFTEPAQAAAPPPPAPAPNVSGKADRNAEYAAKVRAAVQAAVVYPPAAASLHFSGRVRVEFHLRNGIAGQARVLIPSGIGMIDRAALQSVQNAGYPAPPADLQGSDLVYQVWVDFRQ